MTAEEIQAKLKAKFGEKISDLVVTNDPAKTPVPHYEKHFFVDRAVWREVAEYLKYDRDLLMDGLMCVGSLDRKENLTAVYNLYSYTHRHRITVKIDVPREDPRMPSAEPVWKHADWMEREEYDLMGIVFEGHPDLRRVMLPDDWIGHPLRKDYTEPEEYRGILTWRENLLGKLPGGDYTQS
ncbi:MAG TPA: NADH-quinone oxidoreductase subunit C [bacterium]|nr:NADH-quinone oxidoreductase subunit C [bacterium]